MNSLAQLRATSTCQSPGFFKPYHFVTLALMLKEVGAEHLRLPEEVVRYAARMRLWEAIGLEAPYVVQGNASGSRFHELTRLTDLGAVEGVASALAHMVLANVGKPCSKETADSLYITLTELLGNCHHHARTSDDLHGLVCGQSWYQGKRAQFAIADPGIGIRRSLEENPDLEKRLAKNNACELAMRLGISSKLHRGHSGYGLTVARDLTKQTNGALLVLQSGNEAVVVQNGTVTAHSGIKDPLPGTLVVFEWNMSTPLDIAPVYASWSEAEGTGNDFF